MRAFVLLLKIQLLGLFGINKALHVDAARAKRTIGLVALAVVALVVCSIGTAPFQRLRSRLSVPVLLVGLGNRSMTPDSLGPRTMDHVMVTRHLFSLWPEEMEKAESVCAISPGVLGETGIESGEAVKGLVEQICPCAVIAVDTLAAGDPKRMATTIQLGNTGIAPGGGVGNRRLTLDQTTLQVPVLALGIPLVVRADTLFEGKPQGLIVTPKEIAGIVKASALLLARALNQALHPRLPKEMKELLSSQS